ncbi:hypothetical protein B0H14DRAFT_78831 [Mycena olivaceomarginata]|nr:hypothetical protein B0H14DRAFT_78831 [Mycena olivaceomarginata]
MRSVNTRPLLLCLMGPAPRTSPTRALHRPDALPRPCPQHQAPVHLIYDRHQALPLLYARAHGHKRRSSAETPLSVLRARLHAPTHCNRGCATPTDASAPRPFHNRIHRFPRLPPQPQLPFAPLPACAALAAAVLHRQPRATTTEAAPLGFPGLSSTQEHLRTPDAPPRHWEPGRAAPPACAVLEAVRI